MWAQGSDKNKPLNCLEVVEMLGVFVVFFFFFLSPLVLNALDKNYFWNILRYCSAHKIKFKIRIKSLANIVYLSLPESLTHHPHNPIQSGDCSLQGPP